MTGTDGNGKKSVDTEIFGQNLKRNWKNSLLKIAIVSSVHVGDDVQLKSKAFISNIDCSKSF